MVVGYGGRYVVMPPFTDLIKKRLFYKSA